MPAKLGAHMSIAGGCDRAVRAASTLGFETVQLFTKNNNQWRAPELTEGHVAAYPAPRWPRPVVVRPGRPHVFPCINLGSHRGGALGQIGGRADRRGRALPASWGSPTWLVHPGAPQGARARNAAWRASPPRLDEVHRRTQGTPVIIDLETTAGQGTCLGHRFEHLGRILGLVAEPRRLGV